FLRQKLMENPGLFIALTLDGEIIGVVQGFPRDDYLLLSEMAVDARFRGRGFGRRLLREFETVARLKGFTKIKLGAVDDAAKFYLAQGYTPSIFVQVEEAREHAAVQLLGKDRVVAISHSNGLSGIELRTSKCDVTLLREIEQLVKPVSCQFLFTHEF
ncbi:GNAT family N-acetyltransferase, partial [Candidatus Woesearchaeota archaeon]|nr:GNAT family N-acetyltransferase [Candidatus Woesearchaeota archaeon]